MKGEPSPPSQVLARLISHSHFIVKNGNVRRYEMTPSGITKDLLRMMFLGWFPIPSAPDWAGLHDHKNWITGRDQIIVIRGLMCLHALRKGDNQKAPVYMVQSIYRISFRAHPNMKWRETQPSGDGWDQTAAVSSTGCHLKEPLYRVNKRKDFTR